MISKSPDNLTTLDCLRRLRVELLEHEKEYLDLAEVLDGPDGLERRLRGLRDILVGAEAQPHATADTITAALIDELRKVRASAQSSSLPSSAGGAPAAVDESRLVAVLTGHGNSAFHTIATALENLDLDTPSGRRNALALGYNGKCLATTRVLFSTSESGDPLLSWADILRSACSTHSASTAAPISPGPYD